MSNNLHSPKVSVIMPVYNSEQYVLLAIDSVLNQDYQNFELIIINDNSTDNTLEILNQKVPNSSENIILKSISTNKGQGYCRNVGVKLAKGDYIAFIDSDDIWLPNKLSCQMNFILKQKIVFSFTNLSFINESGKVLKKKLTFTKDKVNYSILLRNNFIPTSTVIISKKILLKYKFPEIRVKQDYALWLEILKKEKIYANHFDKVLTLYRKHQNQVTKVKSRLVLKHFKLLRELQHLNMLSAVFYTCCWAFNGFYKHYIKIE